MPITITLSEATVAELCAALCEAGGDTPPVTPPGGTTNEPPTVPPTGTVTRQLTEYALVAVNNGIARDGPGLWQAIGEQLTREGMPADQQASYMNSFNSSYGQAGAKILQEIRQKYGSNPSAFTALFAGTPYAPFL
jgi:hypothetical protein